MTLLSDLCPECAAAVRRRTKVELRAREHGWSKMVPALGSQRRINALRTMGHSATAISHASGLDVPNILKIGSGRRSKVRRETSDKIREVYRVMQTARPANRNAKKIAADALAQGWPTPIQWHDPDDPDEVPRARR